MKILFVLENLSARCGPTVHIALKLAQQWSKRHELYALTRYSDAKPIDGEKASLFREVISFPLDRTDRLSAFIRGCQWGSASTLKKGWSLLTHPRMFSYLLDGKYRECSGMRRAYRHALEGLCGEQNFDVVIGLSAPYYIAHVLADSNVNGTKKALLQMDAYTHNYTLPQKHTAKRRKLENAVAERLDGLFVASFVARDMMQKQVLAQSDRIIPFEIPGIGEAPTDTGEQQSFSATDGRTHYMFVGQFYHSIRNPRFLLELFCRMPQDAVLHLVGGGEESLVRSYAEQLGDRLVCHGWVSSDEAAALIGRADILVNLNNTVKNQLASKLFEYINTGKPVLNICKCADCPSLPYTAKYPNALDVFECGEDGAFPVETVTAFAAVRRGTVIERGDILSAFGENTDSFLGGMLEAELTKLL